MVYLADKLIGSIFFWLFLRLIIRRRLEKDTARKKAEAERLGEEIHYRKEMKKHLGFHVDREEIPFSEEESEAQGVPSSPVMDEEDMEDK
jgi:hypothetical protein